MKKNSFFMSVRMAVHGLTLVWRGERNFRIQILVAIIVAGLGIVLKLRRTDALVIGLLVLAVLILEILNTAVEHFADLVKPRLTDQVKFVKDIMAAAVLLASVGALTIGGVIFIFYF